MTLRQDQLRDKDAIRRDMFAAEIDGDKVEIACHAQKSILSNPFVLNFYEPTESKNVGNTKIQLRFNDPDEAARFFLKCTAVINAFRKNGATTSEELK